jgi:hypothetical protein
MSASSVTGRGNGSANKLTVPELAILSNGPVIYFSGVAEAPEEVLSSPPISSSNSVTFPYPLPGGSERYVVMLTTKNAGKAYVTDLVENDDGEFTGFTALAESEGTIMYIVASIGVRPNL